MNKQLTISALILAALILVSLLLFSYMLLNRNHAHEAQTIDGNSPAVAPIDPYNIPAR